jgi:predicted metal-dependent enzyme (double-stranded beta helix superfamily)
MSAPLHRLVERMNTAVTAPAGDLPSLVTAALEESVAQPDWLTAEQCRASHDHYTRHVLYGDPDGRYTIVAIVWGARQRSPIHAHHTWCGVGVYRGRISEALYRENVDGGPPVLSNITMRDAGTLSFDQPNGSIHRIANNETDPAVSIHIYGVDRARITTGVNRVLGWA